MRSFGFLTASLLGSGFTSLVSASPLAERAAPTVALNNATVTGVTVGSVSKFLGIPFAKPPTGDLRFRLPAPIPEYSKSFDAKAFRPSCPQQAIDLPLPGGLADDAIDFLVNSVYLAILPDSEDCLSINVFVPAGTKPGAKLPVAAWIFGGGFEIGGDQYYDGGVIVKKSLDLGTPMVFVSFNYRVSGFGFMPGKEIKDAGVGNLGLQDQREALRWIQKYVSNFGGDPTKVTIAGESAGAISVASHMITNGGDTEGLFRAGFMMSGSPEPTGDITNGQVYYDDVVRDAGCSGSSDTLQCLREVPYQKLKDAINKTPGIFAYQSLALAYLPRTDGVFFTEDAQQLVADGKIADIPIVNGDKDDEGTLFTLSNLNITTTAQLKEYIRMYWLQSADDATLDKLLELYPQDATKGAPYDTGIFNQLSPQNKRIASFIGDAVFQAPRRYFLDAFGASKSSPIWSYTNKRLKGLPVLGATHATDILDLFGSTDFTSYFVQFCVSLDPNKGKAGLTSWPEYETSGRRLMQFLDGLIPRVLGKDDFRKEGIEYLTGLTLTHPL